MRRVVSLAVLLSGLVSSAQSQIRYEPSLDECVDAANKGFTGDHVIVISDTLECFRDFEARVLQDPEVSVYVNDNFACYRTDASSEEATRVRVEYPTLVTTMLMIVAAPRLDNWTMYVAPCCSTMSKDVLMRDLRAVHEAKTSAEAHQALRLGEPVPPDTALQPPVPREEQR